MLDLIFQDPELSRRIAQIEVSKRTVWTLEPLDDYGKFLMKELADCSKALADSQNAPPIRLVGSPVF